MAKQSTQSELQRLFAVARRDIPTSAELEQLQRSALRALHAGATPRSDMSDLALQNAPRPLRLTKFMVSIGTAGLLAAGAAGLHSHWRHSSTPVAPSLTWNASTTTSPTPSETPMNAPVATAPVAVSSPLPAPADSVTRSEREIPSPPATQITPAKTPVAEAELIERARQQLQNNPARALALTRTHRRLYPKGELAQEREVIAIEALARLGDSKAAEKRAEAFRATQPHSIHDLHLRSTLGDAGTRRAP